MNNIPTKPTKQDNVLTDLQNIKDTWAPSRKYAPMLTVIDSDTLNSITQSELSFLSTLLTMTIDERHEFINNNTDILPVIDDVANYRILTKLRNKQVLDYRPKEDKVLLTANVIVPRNPITRIAKDVLAKSKAEIHPYTGAIINKQYMIHYDVLDLMIDLTKPEKTVLLHMLLNMDKDTNSFKFQPTKLAKELKVRVGVVRSLVSLLQETKDIIHISDKLITTLAPSRYYHIMFNPRKFINKFSAYRAFNYAYSFFTKVIYGKNYPINQGVFSVYVNESVTAVSTLVKRFRKANKDSEVNQAEFEAKIIAAYKAGITSPSIAIKEIETNFLVIKEEIISESY